MRPFAAFLALTLCCPALAVFGEGGSSRLILEGALLSPRPPPARRRLPAACPRSASTNLPFPASTTASEGDCYAWGSGGWDLIFWGNPGVRLPKGGVIRLCAAQSTAPPGSVVFRWREQEGPQGVCRILGDTPQQCPGGEA